MCVREVVELKLIKTMMQSLFEKLTVHSDGQEIIRAYGTRKFISVHKSPPQDPLLRQFNLIHSFITYFSKIRFSTILLPNPKWSFYLRFPGTYFNAFLISANVCSLPRNPQSPKRYKLII